MWPVAALVLTVPFYAMSVLVESLVLRKACRGLSPRHCRSWAIVANLVSYACVLGLLGTAIVWPALFDAMAVSLRPAWMAVVSLVELIGRGIEAIRGAT